MSNSLHTDVVENALTMAWYKRKIPQNVLVHYDRGSQCCSKQYREILTQNKLTCSMSATGYCYDNAAMEAFFHTLKVELVHDEKHETREITKISIVEYIECYYNRKRKHSAIDYMSHAEFELMQVG